MKKLITVLAAIVAITAMAATAFAASTGAFANSRSWYIHGLAVNGSNFGGNYQSNATSVGGNMTFATSTWHTASGNNASLVNGSGGTMQFWNSTQNVTVDSNSYLAFNGSVVGTASVDFVSQLNCSGPYVVATTLTDPMYGYETSDSDVVFLGGNFDFTTSNGFYGGAEKSIVALVDRGSYTTGNAVTQIGSTPWYFFTLVEGDTDTIWAYGNFTKTGTTGASANKTSVQIYLSNNLQTNGTDFTLNATNNTMPNYGIMLGNGSFANENIDFAGNDRFVIFANASMVQNGDMIVAANTFENGRYLANSADFAFINATTFTVALANPSNLTTLQGTWDMFGIFPDSNRTLVGSFTLDAAGNPTDGTVAVVEAGAAAGGAGFITEAQFAANWSFAVNAQTTRHFATTDTPLSWIRITDGVNNDTYDVYGKLMDNYNKKVFVGVGADNAGQIGMVILNAQARTQSTSDDDELLGCVFNPAASFGLEWLLLLLAPVAAVLRSRFRK